MGNPIVGIAAAFAPFGGTAAPPNVVAPAGVVVVVVVVACGGRPERSPPVDATVFTPADLFATISFFVALSRRRRRKSGSSELGFLLWWVVCARFSRRERCRRRLRAQSNFVMSCVILLSLSMDFKDSAMKGYGGNS